MKETRIPSSLQNKQPQNPWGEDEIKSQSARLWHQKGTIMVMPEWVNDDWEKQSLINIAEKLFGKRENT